MIKLTFAGRESSTSACSAAPAYRAACAVTAAVGAAMFGAGQLLPLYFQLGRGEDVLATGFLLISMTIGTAFVLPFSGRLVDRFGSGAIAAVGAIATAATTLPFAFVALDTADVWLQVLLLVRGMALALLAVPATTGAYKAVTRAQLPDAAAQVNIVLRVGGALGGALFAVILATSLPDGTETRVPHGLRVAGGRIAARRRRGALAARHGARARRSTGAGAVRRRLVWEPPCRLPRQACSGCWVASLRSVSSPASCRSCSRSTASAAITVT